MGRLDVLSFWPSFSLLVFFLVILLECRAIAGRVTLPLGGILMVFCYGAIGAPLLALMLQQILTPSGASADSMRLMAWLIAPPIEELAKAVPVIVLAFLSREARRLSIADLTLIGFASGAGFGFVEGNLNAIVNGTLPGFTHLAALGLQTGNGGVFFAGHAVSTALVGLAAGIGLRFLPPRIAYAWAPSAFVVLWASFDHGLYNWKLLNADGTGAVPNAHFVVELLHTATLKGQLATWLLVAGLIIAQFFEAYLCSKAVGARRDLLLAREWRPWVANEWLVALLRAPLGRAAFGQTLAYFRLRRAFYLASFEARRDPGDPTWTRHAHALEERLKRERSILFDPPPGTWLLPFPVLKTYAAEWTWRMRWVLPFTVLLFFLFMLGPRSLPDWLRQFLYGEPFTIAVVTAGLAFAVWRIVLFARQPRPDPLAAEGAAYAGYYTRALLLGCSFVCGLFPAAALLLGWKAFAPGAAFLSGYLPGWISQGGNLQTLLGLGAIGSAVAPDPRPAGEAYRHEIAAGHERIRRLASDIEGSTGAADTTSPGAERPLALNAFLDAMAKLDAERDAQARRQLVLDECERHAGEATIADPAPAAQAVKDEFDRLANALLGTAAKELDAIASLEQAYSRAWAEIMQDLDAHDVLRRRLSVPLRATWQAHEDIGWALRVVEATDEGLLPMQLTLLPELHAVATSAQSTRADMVAAGIERIREVAAQYGEEDPFTFAGTAQADDNEAALLAEFASFAQSDETPKAFGLRTPQAVETPIQPAGNNPATEAEPLQPAPSPVQEALDQLIDSTKGDARYLETIRHLERSAEALRRPIEPVEAKPQPAAPLTVQEKPSVAPDAEHQGELEDLIDAIKRDSGYLDFTKDTPAAQSDEERVQPEPADTAPEARAAHAVAEERETPGVVAPTEAPTESTEERSEPEATVSAVAPGPAVDVAQATDDALEPTAIDEPIADAGPFVPAELGELEETASAFVPEPILAPSDALAVSEAADEAGETAEPETPIAAAPQRVETPIEPVAESAELEEAVSAPSPEPAVQEPATESFVLVAEDEPAADGEEPQPSAEPVALDQGDQLALPLSPAPADAPSHEPPREEETRAETTEPARTEELTSHKSAFGLADLEKPAEARAPAAEVTQSREPDEPAAKTEVRTSLFARLFQSIKRQSAEPAVRWDEPKTIDAKPAQPVVTPSIDDQPAPRPQTLSTEITAPKADWLADVGATKPDEIAARTDDTPLEPIEWPALNRTADVDIHASAPVESRAAEDGAQAPADSAPADIGHVDLAPAAEVAAVETVPTDITPVESEAPAHDAADSFVAEQPAAVEPAVTVADDPLQPASATLASEDASAPIEKPRGADEFSSKADRLSYLLEKLEQAIQAKTATPSAPSEAPAPATDAAPSTPTEIAADSALQSETTEAPIAVELKIEEPQQPVEQTPHADKPDETPAPLAEISLAPAQSDPIEDARPAVDEPLGVADPSPTDTSSERQEPTEAQLRPDRLSFLLNKLFDVAKREAAERPAVPQQTDPEPVPATEIVLPADDAPVHPAESEILDLRGPVPLPEPPEEPEPSGAVTPLPLLETKAAEPIYASASPIEAPAVLEPPPPAPSDTTPAETPSAVPAQEEMQPVAKARDASSDAVQPDQPVAPKSRPRPAEPATHFGSRSKPPRPKSPAPARDAQPMASAPEQVSVPIAPQRAPASAAEIVSAEAEAPASVPRRDWKLARSEPSKPVDTPPVDSAKKPEIRIKTGSGALATTDAAPVNSSAATANAPGKYYGPRLAKADDDGANSPAQQRALGLTEALTQYYAKTCELQPPMHTTDRATLQRIISSGKLEAPRRRGAAWSTSGMSRRGEVAIRLKPGAEQFIEFVPSTEIFGQVPHYYPRGVGKGSFATHVPAGYLEYFDVTVHEWVPLLRGRE